MTDPPSGPSSSAASRKKGKKSKAVVAVEQRKPPGREMADKAKVVGAHGERDDVFLWAELQHDDCRWRCHWCLVA